MIAKSSPVDLTPTYLIKACLEVFSELVARLAKCSFTEGCFPDRFNRAQVTPLLKRDGLDKNILAKYRPISNLNTISKIIERLVLVRLRQHLVGSPSFNPSQSAYRRRHSTETALLRMTDFAHQTIDRGEAMMLIVLDISAAFDMVVHSTLLHRLSYSFGIDDAALRWIKSYLSERSQFVRIGTASSKPTVCDCGVPQGSVFGPILFTVYTSPVVKVADAYGVVQQQYADDTQLYIVMSKMSSANTIVQLQNCVTTLHQWFAKNGLALNPDKSEAVLFSTSQRAKELSVISTIDAAESAVALSSKDKAPWRDAGWEPQYQ